MKHIVVKAFVYNNQESIGFYLERDIELAQVMRTVPEVKWLQGSDCWYIPLDKSIFINAIRILSPYAKVEYGELKDYLQRRKEILAIKTFESCEPKSETVNSRTLASFAISQQNLQALFEMMKVLNLKAYSPKTIHLYRVEVLYLMRLLGSVSIELLSVQQIQSYLLWLLKVKGHSESKVHTTINALKFYFEQVLHRERMFFEIPRPKKPLQLPTVHAAPRIKTIIEQTGNIKHRCMLMLAYGAGMRVSEIVSLQLSDIISERMIIHINGDFADIDHPISLQADHLISEQIDQVISLQIDHLFP
jgi:integrase/recombinase XerD